MLLGTVHLHTVEFDVDEEELAQRLIEWLNRLVGVEVLDLELVNPAARIERVIATLQEQPEQASSFEDFVSALIDDGDFQ